MLRRVNEKCLPGGRRWPVPSQGLATVRGCHLFRPWTFSWLIAIIKQIQNDDTDDKLYIALPLSYYTSDMVYSCLPLTFFSSTPTDIFVPQQDFIVQICVSNVTTWKVFISEFTQSASVLPGWSDWIRSDVQIEKPLLTIVITIIPQSSKYKGRPELLFVLQSISSSLTPTVHMLWCQRVRQMDPVSWGGCFSEVN